MCVGHRDGRMDADLSAGTFLDFDRAVAAQGEVGPNEPLHVRRILTPVVQRSVQLASMQSARNGSRCFVSVKCTRMFGVAATTARRAFQTR